MTNKSKGILLIVLSALCFSIMNVCYKLLGDMHVMHKAFFRNCFALIFSLIIMIKNKESLKGNNIKFLLLRSIFGFLGVITNIYAISNLILADANILHNTSPFFIIIFSVIFLKEPLKKYHIPTLFLALLGAGLVIKPQFNSLVIPSLIGLSSGMFAGSAYVFVRYLSNFDTPETIIFYFSTFSTIVTLPFMVFGNFALTSPNQLLFLLGVGIFGTTAQFLLTYAYRYAPASELSIYNYGQIIFTLFIALLIWKEIPDILSIMGGSLIILAAYINFYCSKSKVDKVLP